MKYEPITYTGNPPELMPFYIRLQTAMDQLLYKRQREWSGVFTMDRLRLRDLVVETVMEQIREFHKEDQRIKEASESEPQGCAMPGCCAASDRIEQLESKILDLQEQAMMRSLADQENLVEAHCYILEHCDELPPWLRPENIEVSPEIAARSEVEKRKLFAKIKKESSDE